MILVSPTDRDLLQQLGDRAMSHPLPEQRGADVLAAVQGRGCLALQRKFLDDLIASVEDGRLGRELVLLSRAEYPVLAVEGWSRALWTADGHLMRPHASRWTKAQLRNLLRSVWRVHGVAVEHTDDVADTAAAVLELEAWFRKDVHRSLLTRPKMPARDSWGLSNRRDFARYFLQGLPGIGSTMAEQLFDHFQKVPLRWDCTQQELESVYGIGPKRARALWEALS